MIKVLTENLVGRRARTALFRTWGSIVQMLPVGGAAVWGNSTWAPDDTAAMRTGRASAGPLVTSWGAEPQVLEVDAAAAAVFKDAGPAMAAAGRLWLGGGGPQEPLTQRDPTSTPLPRAPSLHVYCLYGVGLPSERAMHYTTGEDGTMQIKDDVHAPAMGLVRWWLCADGLKFTCIQEHGVLSVNGDGTVPLMSLGAMCRQPWSHGSPLNPGNATVVTKEYAHEGTTFSFQLQGGPGSAAHVDILANHELLADVVALAAGHPEAVGERVLSDVDTLGAAMWRGVQARPQHVSPKQ